MFAFNPNNSDSREATRPSNYICTSFIAWVKGYKDADADYSLTRMATIFSALCALCETLGPLLVLSNDPVIVYCGIVLICCMHLYIISTLIVDVMTSEFNFYGQLVCPRMCCVRRFCEVDFGSHGMEKSF